MELINLLWFLAPFAPGKTSILIVDGWRQSFGYSFAARIFVFKSRLANTKFTRLKSTKSFTLTSISVNL